MAKMGRYCKAYLVKRFREFPGWRENLQNPGKRTRPIDGKDVEVEAALNDSDVLYLQENFTVTDGIFLDEHVVFDGVTPEWIEFCQTTLAFEVPDDLPASPSGQPE